MTNFMSKPITDFIRKIKHEACDCCDILEYLKRMPDTTPLKDVGTQFDKLGDSLERMGKALLLAAKHYEQHEESGSD
jgi:hypothetical protein